MKKTSVYLTEREAEILGRIAEDEGKSQATVLREALAQERDFSGFFDCNEGDGTSVADVPEEELLRGFGEDDITPYLRTVN